MRADAEARRVWREVNDNQIIRDREAGRAREAAEAAAAEAIRWAEYDRALAAAIAARNGSIPVAAMRLHLWHIAGLACEQRPVQVHWMPRDSLTRKLTSGISFGSKRAIVTPSVVGVVDVGTALHEIGHQRDEKIGSRSVFQREIFAWRWAIDHSLAWDRTWYDDMRTALSTYLATAEQKDVIDVLAVERFLEDTLHVTRFVGHDTVERFEQAEFVRKHGQRVCESRRYCAHSTDTAVGRFNEKFLCRPCLHAMQLDVEISAQRRQRKRGMSPTG